VRHCCPETAISLAKLVFGSNEGADTTTKEHSRHRDSASYERFSRRLFNQFRVRKLTIPPRIDVHSSEIPKPAKLVLIGNLTTLL
jgi:hypothetical protein